MAYMDVRDAAEGIIALMSTAHLSGKMSTTLGTNSGIP